MESPERPREEQRRSHSPRSQSDLDVDEASGDRGSGANLGTPRWVKIAAAIALLLALLIAVLLVTGIGGPGGHGPGRHTGSDEAGGGTPPASVAEGHRPPPGASDHRQP